MVAEAFLRLVRVAPEPPGMLAREEWEAVLRLAARERLVPLIYAAARSPGGAVPEDVLAVLRTSYEQAAAGAARLYGQVADVQAVLAAAGVSGVFFKGAALARFAYDDEALRPFSDIDLLIGRPDVPAVHRALTAAGYAIVGGAPTDADLTWRHGRAYYDPGGVRVPIDVHWRYLGYPLLAEVDFAGLLARSVEVAVEGRRARILAPADHVTASGIAFLRELWYGKPRLRYARDAAEIARRQQVEWPRVLETAAAERRLRTPLFIVLAIAARLLAAPVPPEVLRALRPPGRLLRSLLAAQARRTVLRRQHPAAALLQVGVMRWLDGGPAGLARWAGDLLFIPAPLAGGRRRWLRHLWRG